MGCKKVNICIIEKTDKAMQLHSILGGAAYVCVEFLIDGLAGAIEWGTGYITSIAMLIITADYGYAALKKGAHLRRR